MPKNVARTIVGKIDGLAANPFAPNKNVTALKGVDGFRLRVGDWRVVMRDGHVLRVLHVTGRGSAYKE